MAWVPRSTRAFRVVCGVAVVGSTAVGAAILNKRRKQEQVHPPKFTYPSTPTSPLGKVLASWTTNFEPGLKWDENWDRCEPESVVKQPKNQENIKDYENELKKLRPKVPRHLILIRHGQYNLEGKTDSERYLTKLGQEQATQTGLRLKELGLPYNVVIHSNMARAKETAELIHQHIKEVPTEVDEMLQEGAPIPPEPPSRGWRPEPHEFYKDGCRIEAAFRKYFHRADPRETEESCTVLVCHGNVIRYFVCRALQFPPEGWLRMSLRHGSITIVTMYPSGRVSLRALGDAGYMPPHMLTTS